jgi:hypothetical protein
VSPSEADLRAALREGEGDGVDPYDIIFAVRQRRAHRRTVLLSAAAAVVFVGGAAAGGAALLSGGSGGNGAGGGTTALAGGGGGVASNAGPQLGHRRAEPNSTIGSPDARYNLACVTPQVRRVPTNNGSEPSGPLLTGPVKGFIVCAYPFVSGQSAQGAAPLVVSGDAARSLIASLANTTTAPVPSSCPIITSAGHLVLSMVPVTPDGQHLSPLTATITAPACSTSVTNGHTVRYGWKIPARVAALLHLSRVEPRRSTGSEMPVDLIPSHPSGESGSPPH